MSKTYTITLSDAQDKALGTVVYSQQEWIENAVFARAEIAINEIVNSEVERKLQAGETISGSKEDIVNAANIQSAKEIADAFNEESAARANA